MNDDRTILTGRNRSVNTQSEHADGERTAGRRSAPLAWLSGGNIGGRTVARADAALAAFDILASVMLARRGELLRAAGKRFLDDIDDRRREEDAARRARETDAALQRRQAGDRQLERWLVVQRLRMRDMVEDSIRTIVRRSASFRAAVAAIRTAATQ